MTVTPTWIPALRLGVAAAVVCSLSACGVLSERPSTTGRPAAPVVTAPTQGSSGAPATPTELPVAPPDSADRAQAALQQGLQAYRDGKYTLSEAQLRIAVKEGLDDGADLANAHKHLAFIYCTTQRQALCSESFRSARRADPSFKLTRAEAGHPMWGKVYRRALRIK